MGVKKKKRTAGHQLRGDNFSANYLPPADKADTRDCPPQVPHAVEATAAFAEISLSRAAASGEGVVSLGGDGGGAGGLSEHAVRLMLSMAIVRLVCSHLTGCIY